MSSFDDFLKIGSSNPTATQSPEAGPASSPQSGAFDDLLRIGSPSQSQAAPAAAPVDPVYNIVGKPMSRSFLESSERGREFLQIQEAAETGRRGFGEAVTDVQGSDLPFFIGDAIHTKDLLKVGDAAKRLAAGEDITDDERLMIASHWASMERQAQQWVGGMVGDILRQMPGFMADVGALTFLGAKMGAAGGWVGAALGGTGGLVTGLVKKGVSSAAKRAALAAADNGVKSAMTKFLSHAVGKNVAKYGVRVATGGARMLDTGTAWAVAMAGEEAAANVLAGVPATESQYSADRQFINALSNSDESVVRARMLGLGNNFIQNFSEASGSFLNELVPVGRAVGYISGTEMGQKAGGWLINALKRTWGDDAAKLARAQTAARSGLATAAMAVLKNWDLDTAYNYLRKVGYDGTIEEMGEERLGGFLSGLFGISGEDKGGLRNAWKETWPDSEQFKAEAISFAIPSVTVAAIHRAKMTKFLGGPGVTPFWEKVNTIVGGTARRAGGVIEQSDISQPVDESEVLTDSTESTPEQAVNAVQEVADMSIRPKPVGFLGNLADKALTVVEAVLTGSLSMHPRSRAIGEILANKERQDFVGAFNAYRASFLKHKVPGFSGDLVDAKPEDMAEATKWARNAIMQDIGQARGTYVAAPSEIQKIAESFGPGEEVTPEKIVTKLNEQSIGPDAMYVRIEDLGGGKIARWARKTSAALNAGDDKVSLAAAQLIRKFYIGDVLDSDKTGVAAARDIALSLAHETTPKELRDAADRPYTLQGVRLANAMSLSLSTKEHLTVFGDTLRAYATAAELAMAPRWVRKGETESDKAIIEVLPAGDGKVRMVPRNDAAKALISSAFPAYETAVEPGIADQAMKDSGFELQPTQRTVKLMPMQSMRSSDPVALAEAFASSYSTWNRPKDPDKVKAAAHKYVINDLLGRYDEKTKTYEVHPGAWNTEDTLFLSLTGTGADAIEDLLEISRKAALSAGFAPAAEKQFFKDLIAEFEDDATKGKGKVAEDAKKILALARSTSSELLPKLFRFWFLGHDRIPSNFPYKELLQRNIDRIVKLDSFKNFAVEYAGYLGLTKAGVLDKAAVERLYAPGLDQEAKTELAARAAFRPLAPKEPKEPAAPKESAPQPEPKPVSAEEKARRAESLSRAAKKLVETEKLPGVEPGPFEEEGKRVAAAMAEKAPENLTPDEKVALETLLSAWFNTIFGEADVDVEEAFKQHEAMAKLSPATYRRIKEAVSEARAIVNQVRDTFGDPPTASLVDTVDTWRAAVRFAMLRRVGPELAYSDDQLWTEEALKDVVSLDLPNLDMKRAAVVQRLVKAQLVKPAEERPAESDDADVARPGESYGDELKQMPETMLAAQLLKHTYGSNRVLLKLAEIIREHGIMEAATTPFADQATFDAWVSGKTTNPDLQVLKNLFDAFGYTLSLRISRDLRDISAVKLLVAEVTEDVHGTRQRLRTGFTGDRYETSLLAFKSSLERLLALTPEQRVTMRTRIDLKLRAVSQLDFSDQANREKLVDAVRVVLGWLDGNPARYAWLGKWAAEDASGERWTAMKNLYSRLQYNLAPFGGTNKTFLDNYWGKPNDRAAVHFTLQNIFRKPVKLSGKRRAAGEDEVALSKAGPKRSGIVKSNPLDVMWVDFTEHVGSAAYRIPRPGGEGNVSSVDILRGFEPGRRVLESMLGSTVAVVRLLGEYRTLIETYRDKESVERTSSREVEIDEKNLRSERSQIMRRSFEAAKAAKEGTWVVLTTTGDKAQAYGYELPIGPFIEDTFEDAYRKVFGALLSPHANLSAAKYIKIARLQSSYDVRSFASGVKMPGTEEVVPETFDIFVADEVAKIARLDGSQTWTKKASKYLRVAADDAELSVLKAHYLINGIDEVGKVSHVLPFEDEVMHGGSLMEEFLAAADKDGYSAVTDVGGYKRFKKTPATLKVGDVEVKGYRVTVRLDGFMTTAHLQHDAVPELQDVAAPAVYDTMNLPGAEGVVQSIRSHVNWVVKEYLPGISKDLTAKVDDAWALAALDAGVPYGFPALGDIVTRSAQSAVEKTMKPKAPTHYNAAYPAVTPMHASATDPGDAKIVDYGVVETPFGSRIRPAGVRMNSADPRDNRGYYLHKATVEEVIAALRDYEAARAQGDSEAADEIHKKRIKGMLRDEYGQPPSRSVSFADLFFNRTDDANAWEFAHEAVIPDGDKTFIMGSVKFLDRTPGAHTHAHVYGRLVGFATSRKDENGYVVSGRANIIIAHPSTISRAGVDFDGDMWKTRKFAIYGGKKAGQEAKIVSRELFEDAVKRSAERVARLESGVGTDADKKALERAESMDVLKQHLQEALFKMRRSLTANEILEAQIEAYRKAPLATIATSINVSKFDDRVMVTNPRTKERMTLGALVKADEDSKRMAPELADVNEAEEADRIAGQSVSARGIVVSTLRQFQELLNGTGVWMDTPVTLFLGERSLTVQIPEGGHDAETRRNQHDAMQTLINMVIDDIKQPRTGYLGLDAKTVTMFGAIIFGSKMSTEQEMFDVAQFAFDFIQSPLVREYVKELETSPFDTQDERIKKVLDRLESASGLPEPTDKDTPESKVAKIEAIGNYRMRLDAEANGFKRLLGMSFALQTQDGALKTLFSAPKDLADYLARAEALSQGERGDIGGGFQGVSEFYASDRSMAGPSRQLLTALGKYVYGAESGDPATIEINSWLSALRDRDITIGASATRRLAARLRRAALVESLIQNIEKKSPGTLAEVVAVYKTRFDKATDAEALTALGGHVYMAMMLKYTDPTVNLPTNEAVNALRLDVLGVDRKYFGKANTRGVLRSNIRDINSMVPADVKRIRDDFAAIPSQFGTLTVYPSVDAGNVPGQFDPNKTRSVQIRPETIRDMLMLTAAMQDMDFNSFAQTSNPVRLADLAFLKGWAEAAARYSRAAAAAEITDERLEQHFRNKRVRGLRDIYIPMGHRASAETAPEAEATETVKPAASDVSAEWSSKELWAPSRLAEDFAKYGDRAVWVQYRLAKPDEKQLPVMQGTMYFAYGPKDPGAKYKTTFQAIRAGARTSTTRFSKWPQFDMYAALQPGQKVRFWSMKEVGQGVPVDVIVEKVTMLRAPGVVETGAPAAQAPAAAPSAQEVLAIVQELNALGFIVPVSMSIEQAKAKLAELKAAGQPAAMPDSFASIGKNGRPVTVRRDPVVGWVAEQGAVMSPINEAEAAKYWARRATATPPTAPVGPFAVSDLFDALPKDMQDLVDDYGVRVQQGSVEPTVLDAKKTALRAVTGSKMTSEEKIKVGRAISAANPMGWGGPTASLTDPNDIAKELGIRYDGPSAIGNRMHSFTGPDYGESFSVEEPLTLEKVAEEHRKIRQPFVDAGNTPLSAEERAQVVPTASLVDMSSRMTFTKVANAHPEIVQGSEEDDPGGRKYRAALKPYLDKEFARRAWLNKALGTAQTVERVQYLVKAAREERILSSTEAMRLLKWAEDNMEYRDRANYVHNIMTHQERVDALYRQNLAEYEAQKQAAADLNPPPIASAEPPQASLIASEDMAHRLLHPMILRGSPELARALLAEANWVNSVRGKVSRWYVPLMQEWGLFSSDGGIDKVTMETMDELDRNAVKTGRKIARPRFSSNPFAALRHVAKYTTEQRNLALLVHTAAEMAREEVDGGKPDWKSDKLRSRVYIGLPTSEEKRLKGLIPENIIKRMLETRNRIVREVDAEIRKQDSSRNVVPWSAKQRETVIAERMFDAGIADYVAVPGDENIRQYAKDVVWTIPSQWIQEEWDASDAKALLVANGRSPERLSIKFLAEQAATMSDELFGSVMDHAPSILGIDAPFIRYRSGYATHVFGRGFLGAQAESIMATVERGLRELTKEREASLEKSLEVSVDKEGNPRQLNTASEKMLRYAFNLHDIMFTDKLSALRAIRNGEYADLGFDPDMTYADLAKMIHMAAMNRLIQRTLAKADVDAPLGEISDLRAVVKVMGKMLSKFKMREFSGRFRERGSAGKNFSTTYRTTGLIHDNVGAIDSVRRYSDDMAMQASKEIMLNQVALSADPDGTPLVIPVPIEAFDGTSVIKDSTWRLIANRLSQYTGKTLDPRLSARKNVAVMADQFFSKNPGYAFVKSGHSSLSGYWTIVRGKGKENVLDMLAGGFGFAGGEVGNIIRHVDGEAWTDPWGIFNGIHHVNMWMKTLALQVSFFFPVAAVESMVAAGGIKALNQMLGKDNLSAADHRRMMRSGHPYINDLMSDLEELGVAFSYSQNPMGLPTSLVQKDIDSIARTVTGLFGESKGQKIKNIGELLQGQSRVIFEDIFNMSKLWFASRLIIELREEYAKQGKPFDRKQALKPFVNIINNSMGGEPDAKYTYLTPTVKRFVDDFFFSRPWTQAAWNIAGGGVLTGALLKNHLLPHEEKFIFMRNWPNMFVWVILAVPAAIQAALYLALGKGGDDEDELNGLIDKAKVDSPWLWKNDPGRKLYADITPLIRNSPLYKGEPTGDRRFYIHWGKQSWEIANWFEKPSEALLGKMSQVARLALEQATGEAAGIGWDLGFKDMGLLGIVMDKEGGFGGSRIGHALGKFAPFSILAWSQAPDAAPLQLIAPISKGTSFNKAADAYVGFLRTWAERDTYSKVYKSRKIQANLEALGNEILDAAERNGYDPKQVIDSARAAVLKEYYAKIYKAVDSKDTKAIEEYGGAIARLNGTVQGVMKSAKSRNKLYGKPAVLTDEQRQAIQEAFRNP